MITLEDARRVVSAAEEKAREMGQSVNIAVLDAGRNFKYFARMEDVWLGGIEIAVDKVYTSTSFKMSHAGPGGAGAAGTAALWINTTNNSHVVVFVGGIPIQRDGRVVGTVGVSGGTPDQDQQVAEAGVIAL